MKTPKQGLLKKVALPVVAAALVCAGGLAAATVAGFTDSATSAISVKAGTIDMQLGSTKTFPLDFGSTMKPGETVTKQIVVNNKGSLPLTYSATTVGATSGALAGNLDVVVKAGATTLATGKKLNAVEVKEQTLAANTGTQTLDITVTWPDGTPAVDNALQGASGNTVLTFSATQ